MYDNIELYFNLLKHYGSGCGYYPKTSKSVLIVHPDNLETGNQFGLCHGFKVFTSEWYFGGFIGDDKSKLDWIQDRTLTWENNIIKIIETVEKYTQESYAAVVHVIQPEWIFLQRVTKKMGYAFAGAEKLLQETFFLASSSENRNLSHPS